MTRLLRLTAPLAGLILVTFALGGSFIRPADADEWVALMGEWDPYGDALGYFQVWPGVDSRLTYALAPGTLFWGMDPTGRHAYFSTLHPSLTSLNYYQADSRLRPIVKYAYAETVFPSPDFTWLIYGADDPNGGWDYYVTNTHTGQRWNLSDLVGARSVVYRSQPQFSADGTWLYITVQEPDPLGFEVVGINLTNGAVLDITKRHGGTDGARLRGLVGDWLVFDRGDEVLYRIRTDGSNFGDLFHLPTRIDARYPIFVEATYPAYGLLLLRVDQTSYALDVPAGELRWQQSGLHVFDAPVSSTGWMTVTQLGLVTRLHLPTGEISAMPFEDETSANFLRDSPDGRFVFYLRFNMQSARYEWCVHEWATGESRIIPVNVDYLTLWAVSPDGNWLWVEDSGRGAWRRIRVQDGYGQTVLPYDTYYSVVGWMHPDVQSWHPLPLLLIALALMLIGILPRRLL